MLERQRIVSYKYIPKAICPHCDSKLYTRQAIIDQDINEDDAWVLVEYECADCEGTFYADLYYEISDREINKDIY